MEARADMIRYEPKTSISGGGLLLKKFLASGDHQPGRTCYGIATPVSGCDRSGQSPFCFAAHWVRGSGGDARPSSSFAEDAASSAVLFAARAISFAAAQCWAPAHGAGQGDARSAGLCPWPLSGLVPHPSFGPADPFGSGRSVAVASQAAGDTAVAPVLVQGSAAREGGVLCTAGGTVGISAGASAPGSGPISTQNGALRLEVGSLAVFRPVFTRPSPAPPVSANEPSVSVPMETMCVNAAMSPTLALLPVGKLLSANSVAVEKADLSLGQFAGARLSAAPAPPVPDVPRPAPPAVVSATVASSPVAPAPVAAAVTPSAPAPAALLPAAGVAPLLPAAGVAPLLPAAGVASGAAAPALPSPFVQSGAPASASARASSSTPGGAGVALAPPLPALGLALDGPRLALFARGSCFSPRGGAPLSADSSSAGPLVPARSACPRTSSPRRTRLVAALGRGNALGRLF
ncbi:hypothetical protein PAPYR_13213 [Paratrimastix pyriformis]|uniref:Uncharacterized protein n=1 Tax=Paratrimastix pyriformis TaxID=342808 RepID=A0ABQ8U0K8_9EUKA|nr:hypothetical protein PAPYR_13213 [Paratrimastix pyriformis]